VPKETGLFKSLLGTDNLTFGSGEPTMGVSPVTSSGPATNLKTVPQGSNLGGMYGSGVGPNILNPFVEGQSGSAIPEISGADLAGLTPQMITAVMGLKQAQDQMKQQSFRDLVDAQYKGAVIKREDAQAAREELNSPVDRAYKQALTDKAKADIENDKAIYQVPGSNIKLNAKDWIAYEKLNKENQTTEMKNYEYAIKQGYTGGFMEFKDAAETTHKKDYDEAVKTGYKGTFNTWLTDMAKAGAINLGDLMKKESELTKLQGEKYFANPDWTKDLQSHVGSKDIQNRISDVQIPDLGPKATKEEKQKAYRSATALERAKVNIEFIEGKIAAGGGKVVADPTMDKDGKTVTWKVQWPTGNTTEVKQAIR
jgi:hypothetical protein